MEHIVEYYAVLSKTKNNNVLVEVPDLDMFSYGSDMTEAMDETERCIAEECIGRLSINQPLPVPTKKEDLDSYILKNFKETMVVPMFVKFNYTRPTNLDDIKEKATSLGESIKGVKDKLEHLRKIKKDNRKLKKQIRKESNENLKEMQQAFDEWNGIIDKQVKESDGRVKEILKGLKNLDDTDEEE